MEFPGLVVFARFKAKRGMEGHVRSAIMELITPTLLEDPNIGYALHQGTADPTLFFLYEQWRDKAGFDDHLRQTFVTAFIDKVSPALEEPLQLIETKLLAGETAPTAAGTDTG
jgi:quinol monooxygenase YgiN